MAKIKDTKTVRTFQQGFAREAKKDIEKITAGQLRVDGSAAQKKILAAAIKLKKAISGRNFGKLTPDEKLTAVNTKENYHQAQSTEGHLDALTSVVAKLAQSGVAQTEQIEEQGGILLGGGHLSSGATAQLCMHDVKTDNSTHKREQMYRAGRDETNFEGTAGLPNAVPGNGDMVRTYCVDMAQHAPSLHAEFNTFGKGRPDINLNTAKTIDAILRGVAAVKPLYPAETSSAKIFHKNSILDKNLAVSGSAQELAWAQGREVYRYYNKDEVRLRGLSPVSAEVMKFSDLKREIQNESGFAATASNNGVVEQGATEPYMMCGEEILRADVLYGSLRYVLEPDQFLHRGIKIAVKNNAGNALLQGYEPCSDETTLTVVNICPDDSPCSPIVLNPSGVGYNIVLREGDWIIVEFILLADGVTACWRVMSGVVNGISIGEDKDPCPEILMDAHWLPEWPHSRGRYWHGPQPFLGSDGAGGSIDNAEVPSAVLRQKNKDSAPDDAVSFRFRVDTMRKNVLWNLEIPYSTLDGQLDLANEKFIVSLYRRFHDGSHEIVFQNWETEANLADDPQNPGDPVIASPNALVGRNWAVAKLVDGRSIATRLMENGAAADWPAAREHLMDPSRHGGFWVLRIHRNVAARNNRTHMIHGVKIRYAEMVHPGDEIIAAGGVDGVYAYNSTPASFQPPGSPSEVAIYDINGGNVISQFELDFLTLDGLEGREVCCDELAGPSTIPVVDEDDCP